MTGGVVGRPGAVPDSDLQDLVARHLARFPGSELSSYELSRALGLARPNGNGKDRITRALVALELAGRVVRVAGPANEDDSRLVTRWRSA